MLSQKYLFLFIQGRGIYWLNSSLKAGVEGGLYDAVWLDGVDLELLGVAHQHGLGQLHRVTQAKHNIVLRFYI